MLYKLFKKLFKKELERDNYELTRIARENVYAGAYSNGYDAAYKKFQEDVTQKAVDKFADQNWTVNENHVFQVTKTGIPYLGMEPIKKDKVKNLQLQAKTLQDMELWTILTTLIRQKAIDKAMKESTTYEHVLPGKMMLHNIALMESLVRYLAEVDIAKIPDAVGGIVRDVV